MQYQPISIIKEIFGNEQRQQVFCDIDQGATDKLERLKPPGGTNDTIDQSINLSGGDNYYELDEVVSAFDKMGSNRKPHAFMLHNNGPKYNQVQICGSMDAWKQRHPM